MRFNETYINHLQKIVEDVNAGATVQNAATQQINTAMSMLSNLDDNTLKKTGLDSKKKQLTDAVTQATVNALTKVHTVMSGSLSSPV